MKKILCQNCYQLLGEKTSDQIRYNPAKIWDLAQEIDENTTLLTLQCPKCGCFVQLKI